LWHQSGFSAPDDGGDVARSLAQIDCFPELSAIGIPVSRSCNYQSMRVANLSQTCTVVSPHRDPPTGCKPTEPGLRSSITPAGQAAGPSTESDESTNRESIVGPYVAWSELTGGWVGAGVCVKALRRMGDRSGRCRGGSDVFPLGPPAGMRCC